MKLDTLFENFDLLMDAPNAVPKMRDLILQLAVQGKLVEQDPTDEPAGELLKRIKTEKEKLIAEGKIKKQKPLPPIAEDEIPYELPHGWEWVRMKKIAYNIGQKKPDKRFTYIDVTAINKEKGTISNQVKILEPSEAPSRARKIVQKETVIYSTVRPYLLNVAIVDKEFEPEPIVSTAFAILNPYKNIYNKYLYYFLRSKIMIDYVESKMIGMAYPAINDTQFLKAPFPLPPLTEQKRIVTKVNQLMQLCDQLDACQEKASTKYTSLNDAALEKLLSSKTINEFANHWQFLCNNFDLIYNDHAHVNKLRQAILQLAVQGKLASQDPNDEPASELLKRIKTEREKLISAGKIKKQKPLPQITEDEIPYELPKSWEWERLGKIGDTNIGLTYSPKDISGNGIPVLRANNIQNGKLVFSGLVRVDIDPSERVLANVGDLLICARSGSRALVGKTAIIRRLDEKTAFGAFMAIFRSSLNSYIYYFINSPLFRRVIDDVNTTTINQITQGNLRSTIAPIPPLAEQKRIVAKVDQLMHLCDELETRLNQSKKDSEMLMQAVLYEAFS